MDSSSVEIAVGTWAVGHCCNTEQLYTAAVGKKKKLLLIHTCIVLVVLMHQVRTRIIHGGGKRGRHAQETEVWVWPSSS